MIGMSTHKNYRSRKFSITVIMNSIQILFLFIREIYVRNKTRRRRLRIRKKKTNNRDIDTGIGGGFIILHQPWSKGKVWTAGR